MKYILSLFAVGCLTLALAAPAQAQFYPRYAPNYGGYGQPSISIGVGGYGGNGYSSGYGGFGYSSGYGGYPSYGYTPRYQQGHIDVVPGGFVPHRGHYHYVQPHVDYHIGNRRYEVQQTPFGPVVSPFPHRHH